MCDVTFIAPNNPLEIRMKVKHTDELCEAAKALNARYFVVTDGYDHAQNLPIWGVFDMRKAQKNNPIPGVWTVSDPVKTFTTEKPDAAVMWALAQGSV